MNITCPYCYSENISRATTQQSSNNSLCSMAGAGIGASIAKSLPTTDFTFTWVDWWG